MDSAATFLRLIVTTVGAALQIVERSEKRGIGMQGVIGLDNALYTVDVPEDVKPWTYSSDRLKQLLIAGVAICARCEKCHRPNLETTRAGTESGLADSHGSYSICNEPFISGGEPTRAWPADGDADPCRGSSRRNHGRSWRARRGLF